MTTRTCSDILKAELEILRKKDPKLSLRKFALMLDVPVSLISEVFRGSRSLGVRAALRISRNLAFDESQHHQFLAAVLAGSPNLPEQKMAGLLPRTSPPQGSWKHHAIVELSFLADAHTDLEWISRKLNISIAEANSALNDLKEWGLLEKGQRADDRSKNIIINTNTRRSKIFHAELLGKAEQHLHQIKHDRQDLSAIILPVNKAKIRFAKRKIREFQASLIEYLSTDEKDEVYVLQVNLFPLTSQVNAKEG